MIHFNFEMGKNKKQVFLFNDEKMLIELELLPHTITNKFNIVTSFIEGMTRNIEGCNDWFVDYINEYVSAEESRRYIILEKHIPIIKKYVNEYIDFLGNDYSKFSDSSKSKKSTILLSKEEIKDIICLSCYLKVYSVFSNTVNLRLNKRLHNQIYNLFSKELLENKETIEKIFNVVKTKTFKYNMTDRHMWDYIRMIQCKSIDDHVIEIFNFIMNSILILCEPDKNPISYFVGVVDESVKWFLRSVYKGNVSYDDTVSTEDIHSTNFDNLKTYSFNDTLGRLKNNAYDKLYTSVRPSEVLTHDDKKEKDFIDFSNRIENVQYISPIAETFLFPILSNVTGIPYPHLKTLSPENSIVLCLYFQRILEIVFRSDYKSLISLLSYYPVEEPSMYTTYKIKNMSEFINITQKTNNFLGFKSKLLLGSIIGTFAGKNSRIKLINVRDGKEYISIPLSKIESEMIQFYNAYFSNGFESELNKIKKLVYQDF